MFSEDFPESLNMAGVTCATMKTTRSTCFWTSGKWAMMWPRFTVEPTMWKTLHHYIRDATESKARVVSPNIFRILVKTVACPSFSCKRLTLYAYREIYKKKYIQVFLEYFLKKNHLRHRI